MMMMMDLTTQLGLTLLLLLTVLLLTVLLTVLLLLFYYGSTMALLWLHSGFTTLPHCFFKLETCAFGGAPRLTGIGGEVE